MCGTSRWTTQPTWCLVTGLLVSAMNDPDPPTALAHMPYNPMTMLWIKTLVLAQKGSTCH